MLSVAEIKEIANAKQFNGTSEKEFKKFSISRSKHYENEFFIPVFWREDRQIYIMDAVQAGAVRIYD